MAKLPAEVEKSITVKAPAARAYGFLWDVLGSAYCIPGLVACKRISDNTYEFLFREISAGPVSHVVRYTARYEGNGTDRISFTSVPASKANTEIDGVFRLQARDPETTRITLRQKVVSDSPIPRLLVGMVRSFVDDNASSLVKKHLANIKCALEED